jgi:hypothetical protein
MYCYNLGIHDLSSNKAVMYVWDECTASRGSEEIASCLVRQIKQHCNTKKHIVLFSDTCTGQNRNIKVALSLLKLVQEDNFVTIDHKFMISGHSYLPNDADFGLIEVAAKGKPIYLPEHWYGCMASARKKNKFLVVEMRKEDFVSTGPFQKAITKRKKNTDDEKVNWLQIQWFRFTKGNEFEIQYKNTLDESKPFSTLNLRPPKGRPRTSFPEQTLLYNEPRVLNYLKKRDMLYLLKYIPPVYHTYFRNIRSSQDVPDTGFVSEGDEEVDGEEPPVEEEERPVEGEADV